MKSIKRATITTILILIFLITNPSYNKFKQYSKDIPIEGVYFDTKELFNGFIFSIYSKEKVYTYSSFAKGDNIIGSITTIKYLGILSNFIKISEEAKKETSLKILK